MSIDNAAGDALIGKSIDIAKALLEDEVANNYHWSSQRATSKRDNSKYDVDAVHMLASKVDALTQRFDKLGTSNSGTSSGMMY